MAYFKVDTQKLSGAYDDLYVIIQECLTVKREIQDAASGITGDSAAMTLAKSRINSRADELFADITGINQLRVCLNAIREAYEGTENKILGNANAETNGTNTNNRSINDIIDSIIDFVPWIWRFLPSIIPGFNLIDYFRNRFFNLVIGGDTNGISNYTDGLSLIKKWVGFFDKMTGDENATSASGLSIFGSGIAAIASFTDMFDPNNPKTPAEFISDLAGLGGDLTGFMSDVLTLKFGKEAASIKELGIIGDVYSVLSDAIGMMEYDSIGESLMNTGGLYSDIGSLVQDYMELTDTLGIASEEASKKITSIATLFSMGTYAIGNIIEASKDGIFDISDYGNLLLDTGINGTDSFLKGITFGIVDIDSDGMRQRFDENIRYGQDLINSWNLPTPIAAILGVTASIPITAITAGETIVDFSNSIIDTVDNFLYSIWPWK